MIKRGRDARPGDTSCQGGTTEGGDPNAPQISRAPDDVDTTADAPASHTPQHPDPAPPIRAHVVDRMRWLLAAGEIGRDHAGLADSLIVSMTRQP